MEDEMIMAEGGKRATRPSDIIRVLTLVGKEAEG